MTPAIRASGVVVDYGRVRALDGVDLEIAPGQVTGLVGMNGSGKSTLFKALMGTVRLEAGEVRLDGLDPRTARKRGVVGYVPQSEDVDWAFPLCVRDVVMTGRYGHMGPTRRARPADRTAVADALERVELTELAGRQIGRLSGGQRKRVFVARAIAQGARTLLLDEPFAGVDKRSEATIVRLLHELAAQGCAVVVATHDLHALPQLAESVVLLRRHVLFHGPVMEGLAPEHLVRAFGLDVLSGPSTRSPGDDDAAPAHRAPLAAGAAHEGPPPGPAAGDAAAPGSVAAPSGVVPPRNGSAAATEPDASTPHRGGRA
ncbi:metal ABC transporter ATP-binding protein [Kocuria rhizophila]|uniref:Metal ABC transporter ATP-binding protein n=1 Tax=Kocuria rhizophila TaxID=72000 RepID=A0AAX2SC52_KOCRH|nr:metal ABC transporter ATP-binding protein [Kocuria rhizophila]MDR7373415.1 manganese transport system ATP-binding protein [Kocuria rhizophila]TFH99837.1 metal ABC transporter ATP-binding protein [Kocuria rhizophila]TFI11717.1 metal ABC transporter ATP-binding protein [Kocuria rhizophila]